MKTEKFQHAKQNIDQQYTNYKQQQHHTPPKQRKIGIQDRSNN